MNGNHKVLNCKGYLSSVVCYNMIGRNLYLFIGLYMFHISWLVDMFFHTDDWDSVFVQNVGKFVWDFTFTSPVSTVTDTEAPDIA